MPTHVNLYLLPSATNIRDAIHVPVISGTAGGDFDQRSGTLVTLQMLMESSTLGKRRLSGGISSGF